MLPYPCYSKEVATTHRIPRRDPHQLFRIQSDFAAGINPQDIATKHELPVPVVMQILRSRQHNDGLADPFQLSQDASGIQKANQIYWLGYVAASGHLYPQGPVPTIVLDVDPRDVDHVRTLVEDLCAGRPSCELCQSSRSGLQAYIRDRELGQLLTQWGVPGPDPTEGSVPISLIPGSLLSHFLRGYLEGGRQTPPFGQRFFPASLASIRRVTMIGPDEFVSALAAALSKHLGIGRGKVKTQHDGLRALTFRGRAAKQIVQFAYRNPIRSLPRAAKLVQSMRPRHLRTNGSHASRPR